MLSILIIYNRKSEHSLLTFILLLICMIYPTTMIMLIPSLFMWLIYQKIRFKKKILASITAIFAFILLYGVVYFLNGNINLSAVSTTQALEQPDSDPGLIQATIIHFTQNSIKVILEPFIFFVYQIVSYVPFLLLLAAIIRRQKPDLKKYFQQHQTLFSFLIIAFIIGSYGRSLLSFTENGPQLTNNFFHPLFILVATIVVIGSIYQANKKILLGGLSIVILILGLNIPRAILFYKAKLETNDFEFLVNKLNEDVNESEIAFVSTENSNSTYVYYPYAHLRWYIRNYFPSSLSPLYLMDNFDSKYWERNRVPTKSKYYDDLVNKQKTIPEVIEEYKIKYLLIENKYTASVDLGTDLKYSSKQLCDFLFIEFDYDN